MMAADGGFFYFGWFLVEMLKSVRSWRKLTETYQRIALISAVLCENRCILCDTVYARRTKKPLRKRGGLLLNSLQAFFFGFTWWLILRLGFSFTFVPSASHFLLPAILRDRSQKVTPEFRCARRGRQKGHLAAIAPQAQGSLRTTVSTTWGLIHYENSPSLMLQLVQLIVSYIQLEHVLCANTAGAELPTFRLRAKNDWVIEFRQWGAWPVWKFEVFFDSFEIGGLQGTYKIFYVNLRAALSLWPSILFSFIVWDCHGAPIHIAPSCASQWRIRWGHFFQNIILEKNPKVAVIGRHEAVSFLRSQFQYSFP
jgi:hypothetical protein